MLGTMPPPPPPPHGKKAPGLNPNPKPIGPAKMTAGQKAARDARVGPRVPANANQFIKAGEAGKGHVRSKHVGQSGAALVDRTYGKDPGMAGADPRKQKQHATSATASQTRKALDEALKKPHVQQALKQIAKQPVGTVGKPVTVTLKKPMQVTMASRPASVKVGGQKVWPQGPVHLRPVTVKKIDLIPENTAKGPGAHTLYPTPQKPGGAKKKP